MYGALARDKDGKVALLAEGVDRNCGRLESRIGQRGSPSSRRAWIEIHLNIRVCCADGSPSSRRAWIEI